MNRLKKFLSLSVLSAAALSMTAGACFLAYPNSITPTGESDVSASLVSESITNELPEYLKTEGLNQNNAYFTKFIPLSFNSSVIRTKTTTTDSQEFVTLTEKEGSSNNTNTSTHLFGYYPDESDNDHYYLFDQINISVTLNGKSISIDSRKYIITSSYPMKNQADVHPQVLAMKIERGTSFSESANSASYNSNTFTPGVLTLDESGLLEVAVSYSIYDTTFIRNKDYNAESKPEAYTESSIVLTNCGFTYSAFLFESDEYFAPACTNEPDISYSNFDRETSNSMSTHKWEYFYNYETKELPSLTYDANKVRLTITNNDKKVTVDYDPNNSTITTPSFIKDVVVDENHKATVYFNDIGVYNLHFDLIYNYIPYGETEYRSLKIDQSTVLDQKVHILGAQLSYTDYTDNQFKEFKKFDEDNHTISAFDDNFIKSADVSYLLNSAKYTTYLSSLTSPQTENSPPQIATYILEKNITPVSTNQTPLKLTTSLNSSGTKFKLYTLITTTRWDDGEVFALTQNLSTPGTYLLALKNFGYDGYTATTKTFTQYFYFKINKTTPDVSLTAGEETLYSGDYTNQNVTIKYSEIQNDFDAPVRFELERYDFINGIQEAAKTISFGNDGTYTITNDEMHTYDGKYTLYIYYGKQTLSQKPIKKTFTIDTQGISDLIPYSVETFGINADYKATTAFSQVTNQPFVFTWEPQKKSGADTFGYYKYFPMSYLNYYDDAKSGSFIPSLLEYEMLATDNVLTIDASSTWIDYRNAASLVEKGASFSSSYVREGAGLYIFQVFDEAGNSAVSLIMLDDSKPYFVLKTVDDNGATKYSLITSNYTLTTDATLIWSKNKAIKTIYNESKFNNICTNRNNAVDSNIQTAFRNFLNKRIKDCKDLGDRNGKYYISKIDNKIAFKDRTSERYSIIEASQKEIQFSYTIHYTKNGSETKYYISTSSSSQYRPLAGGIAVTASNTSGGTYIDGLKLEAADVYMAYGTNGYEYYYGESGSLSLNSLSTSSNLTAISDDGKTLINGKVATKVSFVDMEGTYGFLIRDDSNTQGTNLSQEQQYLQYASNYQYVRVSSDSSQMTVYYEENDSKYSLSDASFSRITIDEDNEEQNKKSSYFNPTSVDKVLWVSFIPTISKANSSTTTQIAKITLAYYPFETKSITTTNSDGNLNIAFYRTLASTPLFENEIYNYASGNDPTSETEIEIKINVDKDLTMAGRYVLTRTYMTNEKDSDRYSIDVFDYYERSLTALVDRYGVITTSEAISLDITEKSYLSDRITATKYGNIVIVDDAQNALDDSSCEIIDSCQELTEKYMRDGKIYFVFADEVDDNFKLNITDTTLKITLDEPTVETSTTGTSLESIVGGDIFINMYDGNNNENVISVSFPYYKENGLNSGDTFYTEDNTNWSDSASASTSLTTNKLPVKLYIPEVKFTILNEEEGEDETYFVNKLNETLTYFDTDENFIGTSAIAAYQLVASVKFIPAGGTSAITYTSTAGENGYLAFVDESGNAVDRFSKPGIYTVTITQGYYSETISSNNFRKNYKFAFVIESAAPEFNFTSSGKQLQTLDDKNYYTNQKTATISWEEDTDDRYIAKIDKTQISISYTSAGQTYSGKISIDENGNIVSNYNLFKAAISFRKSGKMNYLDVDFTKLGNYNNDNKFTITMQFEGHDPDYYTTTTKTIVIDKLASNEKISGLIENLSAFNNDTIPMTDKNLRDYKDVDNGDVSSASEAAYNTSKSVGYLKYYAYQVGDDFFESLREMVNANNQLGSNYNGGTTSVYYRAVEDPYTDFTETSYDTFSTSDTGFTDILTALPIDASYYEIVEQDLAGNLTIYLVHKYAIHEDDSTPTDDDYQGILFTDGEMKKFACDKQILSNKLNLYSSKSFSLSKLNFMGDRWTQIKINGTTYMLSPWLDSEIKVYRLTGTGEPSSISLNTIFASFASSTTPIEISLSNGATGEFVSFKLTLLDGAQLNTYLSDKTTEEYLSIGYSNSVYSVKVEIYNGATRIYETENQPNSLENLMKEYTYADSWKSDDMITASINQTLSRITFTFATLPNPNSKIKYVITDNFGKVTKVVHIFGQSLYNEIESSGTIYTNLVNDGTTNNVAQTYYISPTNLKFNYNDTVHAVRVFRWQDNSWTEYADYTFSKSNLTTLTFKNVDNRLINDKFKIVVYEVNEDDPLTLDESLYVKTIYFHLYNMLPQTDETAQSYFKLSDNYGTNITDSTFTDASTQYLTIDGRIYNITASGSTFASSVTFTYTNSESFDYPFTVKYRKESSDNTPFETFKSGKTFIESGVYYFLISYNEVLTKEYKLYKLEILDSATEFYRVTNNGKQVKKAGSYYLYDGTEYSEYYIVNVNYETSNSLIQIVPNGYQQIVVNSNTGISISEGNGVRTVAYRVYNYDSTKPETIKPGTSPFDRLVFITFIPPTQSPVSEAYFTFNSTDSVNVLASSSIPAIAPKANSTQSTLKLYFSNSYGLSNNLIQISVLKDGTPYPMTVKTEIVSNKTLRYVEFTISGTYSITMSDIAGNKQTFASGTSQASQTLKLIFLKSVAFTMTYTDADGVTHTTDPIQKGVFNRKVSLTLLNTNEYYTAQSVGSGQNMITATRNGSEYTNFTFDADTKTFTFSQPGYYTVCFSAISGVTGKTGIEIREEVYSFTIVNPEESRYSFEYSPYDTYYIKSISKDNVGDITRNSDGTLKQEFKDAYQTVIINNVEYLKNISTSVFDSLTGGGRYTIAICTAKALNYTDYTTETEFSFNYWINSKSVPISVSITEGESTSKNITVTFNAERVYEAVGECIITAGGARYTITAENASSLGVVTSTISTTGTYYVTAHSTSGNLLYSYKVMKHEPLNAWAIIAICIGGIAAIVVLVIIIKLRKRIRVK